jgi:hypothetical protein
MFVVQGEELRRIAGMPGLPASHRYSELQNQPQMLAWLAQLVKSVVTALPTPVESLQTQLATAVLDNMRARLVVFNAYSMESLQILDKKFAGMPVAPEAILSSIARIDSFYGLF